MLIFPTGAKAHNWYGTEDGEKIGHQAMSDEDLQGFVEIGEVDLEEGLPEEGTLEVAEEAPIEEVVEEVVEEPCDEPPCEEEEGEAETVEEKVEEIKEDLDELAEMVEVEVTEGEDGTLEIADEESLEAVTEPVEDEVVEDGMVEEEEEVEECGSTPAMASTEEEAMTVAGVEGQWVKVAKLSPENRKKTRDYWLMLGYPQDYVDAMVADYE